MWVNFEIQMENIPTIGNVNKDNMQKYLQENTDINKTDINKYYKHIKVNK